MQLHLLDSYYYRALHTPLIHYLFDPQATIFIQRLIRFFLFSIYLTIMCPLAVCIESCYYMHTIGRQVLHSIDPSAYMSPEDFDTVSFQNPSISQCNPWLVSFELLKTTLLNVCLSISCGLFLAPTTSIMATLYTCINIGGCSMVWIHHMLLGCQYLMNPNHTITRHLSGSKIIHELTLDQHGNHLYSAPIFKKHADAIEFLHDYMTPFTPTHLCPLIFSTNQKQYLEQLERIGYPQNV